MRSSSYVRIPVPLETRPDQAEDLDFLLKCSRASWNAQAVQTQYAAAGIEVSIVQAALGEALAPLPALETQVQVPRITKTARRRALMDLRAAQGWTTRVASAVLDAVVDDYEYYLRAGVGEETVVSLAHFPRPRVGEDWPTTVPCGQGAVFVEPNTLEILGLRDARVPVHSPLPRAFTAAIARHAHGRGAARNAHGAELERRLLLGDESAAASLRVLENRYGPLSNSPWAADLGHHPLVGTVHVDYCGVSSLSRDAGDAGGRWHAYLDFEVQGLPEPVYPLVGVDVGIRHPVTTYAPQGTTLITNPLHRVWACPSVSRRDDRVRSPRDEERGQVLWFRRLHEAIRDALDAVVLGPGGLLAYERTAMEMLDFGALRGPGQFAEYWDYVLGPSLDILEQLLEQRDTPVVYVPPAGTSITCARGGERGRRKGVLFSCGHGTSLADVNAAQNIYRRGQESLSGRTRW